MLDNANIKSYNYMVKIKWNDTFPAHSDLFTERQILEVIAFQGGF